MRESSNNDLPTKTTIGKKNSDIIGNFAFKPHDIFKLDYDFSYEDDLNKANFENIKFTSKINNFVTSFEFLNENNNFGNLSYLENKIAYDFWRKCKLLTLLEKINGLQNFKCYKLITML